MKGQTAIELDDSGVPLLPPPPEFWPMTTSTYSTYKVQRRQHCDVCIRLLHAKVWQGPPRIGVSVRRKAAGQPVSHPDTLILCYGHKLQYVTRDNEARVQAGLDTLNGGA
jgi:hypothetical protein